MIFYQMLTIVVGNIIMVQLCARQILCTKMFAQDIRTISDTMLSWRVLHGINEDTVGKDKSNGYNFIWISVSLKISADYLNPTLTNCHNAASSNDRRQSSIP